MRNEGIFVLLPTRDLIMVSNHFRRPAHWLRIQSTVQRVACMTKVFYTYLHTIMGMLIFSYFLDDFRCWSRTRVSMSTGDPFGDSKNHLRLMLSAPTAIPSLVSPVWIACAIWRMAMRPDEHSLFTTDIGTSYGIPAAMAAALET